jgi:hypothetical protein
MKMLSSGPISGSLAAFGCAGRFVRTTRLEREGGLPQSSVKRADRLRGSADSGDLLGTPHERSRVPRSRCLLRGIDGSVVKHRREP